MTRLLRSSSSDPEFPTVSGNLGIRAMQTPHQQCHLFIQLIERLPVTMHADDQRNSGKKRDLPKLRGNLF